MRTHRARDAAQSNAPPVFSDSQACTRLAGAVSADLAQRDWKSKIDTAHPAFIRAGIEKTAARKFVDFSHTSSEQRSECAA